MRRQYKHKICSQRNVSRGKDFWKWKRWHLFFQRIFKMKRKLFLLDWLEIPQNYVFSFGELLTFIHWDLRGIKKCGPMIMVLKFRGQTLTTKQRKQRKLPNTGFSTPPWKGNKRCSAIRTTTPPNPKRQWGKTLPQEKGHPLSLIFIISIFVIF